MKKYEEITSISFDNESNYGIHHTQGPLIHQRHQATTDRIDGQERYCQTSCDHFHGSDWGMDENGTRSSQLLANPRCAGGSIRRCIVELAVALTTLLGLLGTGRGHC